MFVRKNLGAALMDRATACASYPPGSDGWNRWGCGATAPTSAPAPAPAPAATPTPSPYPQPGTYVRPPPPPPVIVTVDNAAAQRAEREYNERLQAQMAQTEAQRAKDAADAAAQRAQREADALRAQSNSGLVDWSGGAAPYASTGGVHKSEAPVSSSSGYLWAIAAVAVGLILAKKKK